jgi:hypothetical protein
MSASTRASGFGVGVAAPIMDTLHRPQNVTHRSDPLESII